MPKMIARACVGSMLVMGLLLTGCSQSQRTPPPAHQSPDNAGDEARAHREPQAQPHEYRQNRPASVVFVEYVVTPRDIVSKMLKLARVRSDDIVYDLGCGDGRILIAAAKKYGCRAVGYDLDHLRVAEARANAERNHVADRVTVELQDVLEVDLREATVVTLYLGTELNRKLIPQLKQLKPGTRIVSHNFGIKGFVPDEVVRVTSREDHEDHLIYLWTCPLKRDSQQ